MKSGILSKWCVVIVCACAAVVVAGPARVIYVDAGAKGAGTGSSWADAYNGLQDALAFAAAAEKPVEIRVAQGLYKPDQGVGVTAGDRAATFQLLDGVILKGSYAGTAGPDPNARDVGLHETILSGDLAGNDVEVKNIRPFVEKPDPTWTENSFRVVTGSGTDATAGLDGFTITAGCAMSPGASTGPIPHGGAGLCNEAGSPTVRQCVFRTNFSFFYGGAVYNQDGSPTFSRCTFERNGTATRAGAMQNYHAAPTLTGCTFSANVTSRMAWGGAITNEWYSHVVLKDCAFAENESERGGAIYSGTASAIELDNCRFDRNRAAFLGKGGAIFCDWSDLTMTGCTFDQNSAVEGGGAVRMGLGMLRVSYCTFTYNTLDTEERLSTSGGGALYCERATIATVVDTTFEGNSAGIGGAIRTDGYHMDIARCSFVDNVAWNPRDGLPESRGGALYGQYAWVRLTDCTFGQNRASDAGGALWTQGWGEVFLTGCEFTGNEARQGGALVVGNLHSPVANCLFSGNRAQQGGAMYYSSGAPVSLRNCTFAANVAGDGATLACDARDVAVEFSHCVVWDGPEALWGKRPFQAAVAYSDFRGGHAGEGNLDIDPCFVSPGHWSDPEDPNAPATAADPNAVWVAGDYHLRSQAGHWDRQRETWVPDDQTSPCIDAGNPAQPFEAEPFPNGGIVNLGAYGATTQASKSYFGEPVCETEIAGDINGDCKVDPTDLALSAQPWRALPVLVPNQPPTIVISQPPDGAAIDLNPSDTILTITADAADSDGAVKEVQFSIEYRGQDELRRTSSMDTKAADGWQWRWDWQDLQHPYRQGQYTIQAYAIDDDGALVFSPRITVTIHMTK